jgi:hypothetical protein
VDKASWDGIVRLLGEVEKAIKGIREELKRIRSRLRKIEGKEGSE